MVKGRLVHQHDYAEIEASLSAFLTPGEVFEVRLIHRGRKRIDAGYFNHPMHAATAIAALEDSYQGIYFTPNPVNPALLARAANRINTWAQNTTLDPDIVERRWLLIDVDPERPAGISATENEFKAAFNKAVLISNTLDMECGWPKPYINLSGNGCHLMYAMREPNTNETRDAVSSFLKILNARFKDTICTVDTTVFNAARIWRVPGTHARKGDNTLDRPHRKAAIQRRPDTLTPVKLSQIVDFNERNGHYLTATGVTPTDSDQGKARELLAQENRYRHLNNAAMQRIKEWALVFFPAAREYKEGYRVSSADLGLTYEEDLTIHPYPLGIKYFGIADQGDANEGRRTPVGLISEFCTAGDMELAARKLADVLKSPVTEFTRIDATPASGGLSSDLPGADSPKLAFDFSAVPNMQALMARNIKEQEFIVKGLLPCGNLLLTSRPKMRKTFLALQLGMAVAEGDQFLGFDCTQADVLFLGLEDNEPRLRSRIRLLRTFKVGGDLSGFRYWTGGVSINAKGKEVITDPDEHRRTYEAFPRGEAGVDALRAYLDTYPRTRLIVIDTLAHFRDHSKERDVYQRDYDSMMPLTRLASERNLLILTVHHEKKGLAGSDSGDFIEDVSGTSGITGGADGIISIKGRRGPQEETELRKLLVTGRDVPFDHAVDMKFDAERGGWLPAARQDAKLAIIELLRHHPFITQPELKALLPNYSQGRLSQTLVQMMYEGVIDRGRFGYSIKNG